VTDAAPPAPPTPSAAARFSGALFYLLGFVTQQIYLGHASMPRDLNLQIFQRLSRIKRRFDELAQRIRDGKFKPRRPVKQATPPENKTENPPPDSPTDSPTDGPTNSPKDSPKDGPAPEAPATSPRARKPPPRDKLPRRRGWLTRLLIPRHDANHHRNMIERMLGDPEIKALLEAAPAAMGRPIRSLCWMLGIDPPAILARPPRPRRPRPKKEKPAPFPPYKPPYHPDMPAWLRDMPINPHLLDPSLYHRKSRRPRKRMA
jgi:hypothetical protein